MSLRFDVWSDFVCPWCFLLSLNLEKLQQTHDVRVVWRSFELRPKDGPPIPADYLDYIENVGRPRFEATARAQYGIEIMSGPFDIDSRPALMGAKYAEKQGLGEAYHKAMFRAYWLEAKNIENLAVLKSVAESVGLDGQEFLAAVEANEVDLAVSLDIRRAQQFGINSVPSMIVENTYLVSGAQPYDVLVEIVDKVQRQQPAGTA